MFEIVSAPKASEAAYDGSTYALPEFPAHRFTESGTPIRVSQPRRGIRAPLGEEKPVRVKKDKEWYRLPHISGTNRTVSRDVIREKLFGFGEIKLPFRTIDEFPNNLFDEQGGCYRRSNRKPVAFVETALMNEKRYRIWSKDKDAYVYLTNVAIIHFLDGKCNLNTAKIPDDYKFAFEFPGYAFHPSGESVVRYSSDHHRITSLREIQFQNDWSVVITNWEGRKVRLNKRQIAELAGNDESAYAPEPEPISVCPAFFASSDNPRDHILPQFQPQYDAEQERYKRGETIEKPIWPPHLR